MEFYKTLQYGTLFYLNLIYLRVYLTLIWMVSAGMARQIGFTSYEVGQAINSGGCEWHHQAWTVMSSTN